MCTMLDAGFIQHPRRASHCLHCLEKHTTCNAWRGRAGALCEGPLTCCACAAQAARCRQPMSAKARAPGTRAIVGYCTNSALKDPFLSRTPRCEFSDIFDLENVFEKVRNPSETLSKSQNDNFRLLNLSQTNGKLVGPSWLEGEVDSSWLRPGAARKRLTPSVGLYCAGRRCQDGEAWRTRRGRRMSQGTRGLPSSTNAGDAVLWRCRR
jgi:hypothetical protein